MIAQKLGRNIKLDEVLKQLEGQQQALDQFAIVTETDAAGCITYVNDQFCKISKYTREELLGKDHRELVNSGYHPKAFWLNLWSTISQGQIWRGDIKNRAKDNSIYWADTTIVPFLNPDGKPYKYLAIRAVITERKLVEEAYRLKDEKYRLLVESIKDLSIILLDLQGHVTSWNEGAQRAIGYTSEEIIGQSIGCFYVPEDKIQQKLSGMLKTVKEQGRLVEEGWKVRKDGSRFWAEVVITAIHDRENQLIGFSEMTRDLTERKQADMDRERYIKSLASSNTELRQFAYVASHDLQEPLRMITSYTQLLSKRYKGKLDADADEFIGYATDGAMRMRRLIEDLLMYSRLGSEKVPLVPIDCNDILKRALINLSITVLESGATVTSESLPVVHAVESQLLQLIQNLVGNAIKYHGSAPPLVHVSAQKKESEWVFAIRDNGIGLDPQFVDRIFIIFQRLHTSDKYAGTGIGLAVCKKIVERHEGRIWVESKPGQGATFYFTLPIKGDL
jgi:PAS domain S-box-containing protein